MQQKNVQLATDVKCAKLQVRKQAAKLATTLDKLKKAGASINQKVFVWVCDFCYVFCVVLFVDSNICRTRIDFVFFLYLSPSLSVCGCQDCEINRLRAKLKRDFEANCQELKNSAVELDKANAQAQLHREQAEDLRREKSDLQKEMAATLKQKAVEVKTGHVWCRAQGARLR